LAPAGAAVGAAVAPVAPALPAAAALNDAPQLAQVVASSAATF
jgi:hypothetical protein